MRKHIFFVGKENEEVGQRIGRKFKIIHLIRLLFFFSTSAARIFPKDTHDGEEKRKARIKGFADIAANIMERWPVLVARSFDVYSYPTVDPLPMDINTYYSLGGYLVWIFKIPRKKSFHDPPLKMLRHLSSPPSVYFNCWRPQLSFTFYRFLMPFDFCKWTCLVHILSPRSPRLIN